MTARHHHYLSQCYLKGFTKGRAKKSKLVVFDLDEKRRFETTPRNVGGTRDFNRVEIDGIDQNLIEKALSDFEGKADSALKKLGETKDFSGEVKELIINLIALIAVRSPERREHMRKFEAQFADQIIGLALENKERWEYQMAQLQNEEPDHEFDVPYEDVKAFFDSKKYEIHVSREHHIHMEMVQVDAILPCLAARDWELIEPTPDAGPFITCDNPVSLSWINPDEVPPIYKNNPGFGLKGTRVYFPISQDLALMGEFDRGGGPIEGSEKLVALCNSIMLHNSYRRIFSPKTRFKFCGKDGQITDGNKITGNPYAK